jgi:hypothetical protein
MQWWHFFIEWLLDDYTSRFIYKNHIFHSFLLRNKKFNLGFKKFFGFLDIYKCPIFTLQIFKSKSCFFRFLQNRCFQTVIDYGVIFGGIKQFIFYAVKKGVPLLGDVIIRLIFGDFCDLLAYMVL